MVGLSSAAEHSWGDRRQSLAFVGDMCAVVCMCYFSFLGELAGRCPSIVYTSLPQDFAEIYLC